MSTNLSQTTTQCKQNHHIPTNSDGGETKWSIGHRKVEVRKSMPMKPKNNPKCLDPDPNINDDET
ncbi:hypothetical protein A2U01_0097812, partial [Trifolium medium]|nr:hypothetical protein [Trifolium medium]